MITLLVILLCGIWLVILIRSDGHRDGHVLPDCPSSDSLPPDDPIWQTETVETRDVTPDVRESVRHRDPRLSRAVRRSSGRRGAR